MKINWIVPVRSCCGKPGIFLLLFYAGLGVLFLIYSPFADQRIAIVGGVLCAAGIGSLLMCVLLAFIPVRPDKPVSVARGV